jgi:aldehyde:ferredoxin oxidoreductase
MPGVKLLRLNRKKQEVDMPYGYTGQILHINLTRGKLEIENPPESFYRKYMGGSAMGMYYILREMPAVLIH